jgi:hypothetical protein
MGISFQRRWESGCRFFYESKSQISRFRRAEANGPTQ